MLIAPCEVRSLGSGGRGFRPRPEPARARSRARLHAKYPTAALAVIDFEAPRWRDLAEGEGMLERFVAPRDLD